MSVAKDKKIEDLEAENLLAAWELQGDYLLSLPTEQRRLIAQRLREKAKLLRATGRCSLLLESIALALNDTNRRKKGRRAAD